MVREALQTVFRYGIALWNDRSRPSHYNLDGLYLQVSSIVSSTSDRVYAIVFIAALGLSVLGLGLTWYLSGDPLFAKQVIRLPRFRFREYESLPTFANGNANGVNRDEKSSALEELKGWRLRMGVLQGAVLLALTIVHTVILLQDGANFLRIVFIVYWVRPSQC
jgi:hypothetical protein